jgi:hypothetical protein
MALAGNDEIDGGHIGESENDDYLIGGAENDVRMGGRPETMKLKVMMEMIRCLEESEMKYCLVEES